MKSNLKIVIGVLLAIVAVLLLASVLLANVLKYDMIIGSTGIHIERYLVCP